MRLDILIFALIAGYVFYRLWRVLGVRVEVERVTVSPGEVVVLRTPQSQEENEPSYQNDLQALVKREPSFDVEHFLQAAERMLNKIVKAYAEGDVDALRRFVSPPLCEAFEAKIEERKALGQQRHVDVMSVEGKVTAITLPKKSAEESEPARIFVDFKSEQVIYTVEKDGSSYDNPSHLSKQLIDHWVFARLIGSSDPIWYVESTRSQQS